jgi:glycosyltransferase involved in cell wall biosynthesis
MILSVVVPVYNQNENLEEFYRELKTNLPEGSEIIFVDDGSTDGTMHILKNLAAADPAVKILSFWHSYGVTAALAAGFALAKEEWILTIGADLQNDPMDIVRLVETADKGYDVVCGWRVQRRDPYAQRQLPDRVANGIIALLTGVGLHDYACPLKMYRREFVEKLSLAGETHRFLPAYLVWNSARLGEVGVQQRPYVNSIMQHGLRRMNEVVFDILLTRYFLSRYTRPLYFLGGVSVVIFMAGIFCGLLALLSKGFYGGVAAMPLLLAAFLLFAVAACCFVGGFVAETATRTYATLRGQIGYEIRERVNC